MKNEFNRILCELLLPYLLEYIRENEPKWKAERELHLQADLLLAKEKLFDEIRTPKAISFRNIPIKSTVVHESTGI